MTWQEMFKNVACHQCWADRQKCADGRIDNMGDAMLAIQADEAEESPTASIAAQATVYHRSLGTTTCCTT